MLGDLAECLSGFSPQHCEEQKPTRLDDSMTALRVNPTVPTADFWDLGRIHHAHLSASERDAFLPRFLPLVLNCHFLGMLSLVCPLAFLLEGLYLGGAGQSTHCLHSADSVVRLHGVLGHVDDLCACFLIGQTASAHSALAHRLSRGGLDRAGAWEEMTQGPQGVPSGRARRKARKAGPVTTHDVTSPTWWLSSLVTHIPPA